MNNMQKIKQKLCKLLCTTEVNSIKRCKLHGAAGYLCIFDTSLQNEMESRNYRGRPPD